MEQAETKYTIYKHTNKITGKSYIGLTVKTMEQRWKEHVRDAFSVDKKACPKFHNAIKKYGVDCWEHEILDIEYEEERANHREIFYIRENNSIKKGYNIHSGGGMTTGTRHHRFSGWFHTPIGKFESCEEAGRQFNLPSSTIHRWTKGYPDKTITRNSIWRNDYLNEDMLGKTYRDLGFWFELA